MMVSWTQRQNLVQLRFNSSTTYVYFSSELPNVIDEMCTHMLTQMEHPTLPRSGFILTGVDYMDITVSRDRIIAGSGHILLPKSISSRGVTINFKNDDDTCFMWATLAVYHNQEISSHSEGDRYNYPMQQIPEISEFGNPSTASQSMS